MSKLTKRHAEKLLPTSESLVVVITTVPFHTILENMKGGKLHQLCKNHLSLVHPEFFEQRTAKPNSNRCSIKKSANEDISRLSKNNQQFIRNASDWISNNVKPNQSGHDLRQIQTQSSIRHSN